MQIASILCIIRSTQRDEVLSPAFALARLMAARVVVMVMAEAMPVPVAAPEYITMDVWMEDMQRAKQEAETRAGELEALLVSADLRGSVQAHAATPGEIEGLVANAARYVDLVLMPSGGDGAAALQHAIVSGALFQSGSPVLLMAPGADFSTAPEVVSIAWSATRESARAVKEALPLLKSAKRVLALLIDPAPSPAGHGEEPGADLAVYLSYHGVEVEVLKVPSEWKHVHEVIGRHVTDQSVDLLVMGGYGHSRLRQQILGGTTSAILKAPPCPVFLAH